MTRGIGVIGLGAIAPYFLDAITRSRHWHLAAVCDVREEKTTELMSPTVVAFGNYEELLSSRLVDAVIITLPNHLHAIVIQAALSAGVHVCCEKPLTLEASRAHALAQEARERDLVLLTASHRRYNYNLLDLEQRLPERVAIAKVTSRYFERIEEHTGDDDWYLDTDRCGGGCLMDNGPNAIDALRVLLGELDVVDCELGGSRRGNEFCASVFLVTRDGIPVTVELDWAYPGQLKDITIEITDGSTLRVDMLQGFEGLKGSLAHEYDGIMEHFHALLTVPTAEVDSGPRIVELIENAYVLGRTPAWLNQNHPTGQSAGE